MLDADQIQDKRNAATAAVSRHMQLMKRPSYPALDDIQALMTDLHHAVEKIMTDMGIPGPDEAAEVMSGLLECAAADYRKELS